MITVRNLTKIYESQAGNVVALDNLSLDITEGQFVAITGRSGSGKSTFLYQMGLLDHPSHGTITIGSTEVTGLNSKERTKFRLKELGYVFQDYAILPSLTAIENVMVPLLMLGYNTEESKTKAAAALKRVGIDEKRFNNLPGQLSGGQQQRVSIARAISHEPKILFADEPTANLDTETSDMVLDTFLQLNKAGQTIIMVTHEKEYAALAHRIVELSDGKIITESHNKIV